MEHITVIDLGNDMVKLVPVSGYQLLDNRNNRQYSEAVIKARDAKYFTSVVING